jgi:Protein of unknown function (DUF2914)/Tetratricopeptide repeat
MQEPRSIIEAAEHAAAAGDYVSAETLLRDAARLQEEGLGPLHPELVNTLNNLGVVCEITGKLVDAEQFFRRACDIATAVFDQDHPVVATSRKNLHDFCESHGYAESENLQPVKPRRSLGRLVVGAVGPGAMLIVILVMGRPWASSTEQAENLPATEIEPASDIPAPQPAPLPVAPNPDLKEKTENTTTRTEPAAANANGTTAAVTHVRPVVVRAQLCATLDDWLCDPADRPVPQGPLFFYTQVKSTSATTIQHRWYQGDRLRQSADFHIQASKDVGYRTYSRITMDGDRAGSWRVELRTEDGGLLHEERFSVQ